MISKRKETPAAVAAVALALVAVLLAGCSMYRWAEVEPGEYVVLRGGGAAGAAAVQSIQVNINKASLEDLSELKGIGPKYAERIIEYRQQHGPFKQREDMAKVTGIGPKTIEVNRDVLSVN